MAKKKREPGPAGNWDFVEHGSEEHAGILGLRKATEEDGDFQYHGWTLEDPNMFGITATERFLLNHLRQQVNDLESPQLKFQSEDRFEPHYAPPLQTLGQV